MIPAALPLVVLALAAWRSWHLAALDSLPPLVWARTRLVGAHPVHGAPLRFDRPLIEEWLSCPYCSGLWIAVAWYGAWLEWGKGTMYAAVPLALSAAVALIQSATPD